MRKFNLGNDRHIQHWRSFSIESDTYDLGHLDAEKVCYWINQVEYRFYVTYSHHCFTKTVAGLNEAVKYLYPSPKDKRHFHMERYRLSYELPRIIKALPDAITYHGRRGSYAVCEIITSEGDTIYYQVAFSMFRVNKKYRLHITTAFPLPARPKVKKVRFERIVKALAAGKKLPLPQK